MVTRRSWISRRILSGQARRGRRRYGLSHEYLSAAFADDRIIFTSTETLGKEKGPNGLS
jgi:hypothetical protein